MKSDFIDPTPLIDLATAYWGSATLIGAIRLNLFDYLDGETRTASELAKTLGAHPVALEALLAGCTSLGLLEKNEDYFSNTPLAAAFLVNGKPSCLAPGLLYNGDVYPLWNQLDSVVKDGTPQKKPDQYLGEDASRTRNFVYGMHHRALGVGQAVAHAINLTDAKRLADIGGGPGTYSCLLSQAYPGLQADVLDLPAVVDIASEIVASMGASQSVRCLPFDYYEDELNERYDAVLISGVLHREQPDGVRRILEKASDSMDKGGVLYISDVMLDDDRAGPLFSTMFALNMRVLAHDGRCHSVAEQTEWLAEVGLVVTESQRLAPPINYTVIRAEKR